MITCSSCQRPNRLHRGYCGQCGVTLQPVCRGCRFVNEGHDRFCGGCGCTLDDRRAQADDRRPADPLPRTADASAFAPAAVTPTSEISELFAPVAVTVDEVLPASGITQSDLDRLFGVIS